MTPAFEMNDQLGWLMGYPVIEDPIAPRPMVMSYPIHGSDGLTYTAVVVPNFREFENELWIETSLHTAIRKNLGATLEWLYGEGASRRYVAPSSRYSNLMLRLELERAKDGVSQRVSEVAQKIAKILAPAAQQASVVADGLSGGIRGYGSIPSVDFRDTSCGNRYDV